MRVAQALRVTGPVTAMSVGASSYGSAITIVPFPGESTVTHAAFLNTGSTVIAVTVSQAGSAPVAAAIPADGAATAARVITFILPQSMQRPLVYAVPSKGSLGFEVNAIGSAAGPSLIYIQPVAVD